MPHTLQYPDTWHDREAAEERAWLDDWARTHQAELDFADFFRLAETVLAAPSITP